MEPNDYNIIFENLLSWGIKYLWLIGGLCLSSIFLILLWFLCVLIYMGKKIKMLHNEKDPFSFI